MENPCYLKEPIELNHNCKEADSVSDSNHTPIVDNHTPIVDNHANAKKEQEEKEKDPKNFVAHVSEVMVTNVFITSYTNFVLRQVVYLAM